MRTFEGGATRDDAADKLDFEGFFSPDVLTAFALYMHKHRVQADGGLRDSDNWQKGMPRQEYVKSLLRHVMEVWWLHRQGGDDEDRLLDALAATMFNTQGLMFEILKQRNIQQ